MKILVRNSDNVVIYAQDDMVLGDDLSGDGWRDPHFNTTNSEITEATLPPLWRGAEWMYIDGEWLVLDEAKYNAEMLEYTQSQARIMQEAIIGAMSDLFDTTAQSRGYDNRITCALRAGYPGPFHTEGQAFAIWMDTCNALAYTKLQQIAAGTAEMPNTVQEALSILPEMVWPV